jgi:hypothetical protein
LKIGLVKVTLGWTTLCYVIESDVCLGKIGYDQRACEQPSNNILELWPAALTVHIHYMTEFRVSFLKEQVLMCLVGFGESSVVQGVSF